MQEVRVTFTEALELLEPGDHLFYKGSSRWGRGIRVASLSPYSHVGMVGFRYVRSSGSDITNKKIPVLLEVVQWAGGRDLDLQQQIEAAPGSWDLYKINTRRFPEFNRYAAESRMWEFRGVDYGWGALSWASLIYLPGVRLFQKVELLRVDDAKSYKVPPFCSMACCISDEYAGVDPVNNLRHSMTTPGHLSQSKLFDDTYYNLVA